MSVAAKVAALSRSAHTGRALKAAKVLNLIGTVRGAATTVLLASSAIGGAVTVNNVRQDIAKDHTAAPAARLAPARTSAPTASPVTPVSLRADAQKRLQSALDQNAAGADDLRKISILAVAATDALVAQTRQRLQARFDQAMTQVDALLVPSPSEPPPSSAAPGVVAVNSLVQVALGDMSGILVSATKQVTEPIALAATPRVSVPPTLLPVRTAAPTPTTRTPTPTVKASPTR